MSSYESEVVADSLREMGLIINHNLDWQALLIDDEEDEPLYSKICEVKNYDEMDMMV